MAKRFKQQHPDWWLKSEFLQLIYNYTTAKEFVGNSVFVSIAAFLFHFFVHFLCSVIHD